MSDRPRLVVTGVSPVLRVQLIASERQSVAIDEAGRMIASYTEIGPDRLADLHRAADLPDWLFAVMREAMG